MKSRIQKELELVVRSFGELAASPDLDWFVLNNLPLGQGWSKRTTRLLVLLPGGYPTTPPDNFYADADLRLASGGMPGSANPDQQAAGGSWLMFSYHVETADWTPAPNPEEGHNLVTFLDGVHSRLKEPN